MPQLPGAPSLEWLRKQARRRLADLKREHFDAKLADAQLAIAREYGFPSWRALKGHVDSLSLSGQLFQLAREGNLKRLAELLDEHPDAIHAREAPYGWTLLHAAAQMGHVGVVDLLLQRGLDVNTKEQGDDTTALHWAAAAGKTAVVRRLLDAGVDPVGAGDDHELTAIGWATCWLGTDTDAHREVVRMLLDAGARHTIFSAVGAGDADAIRRIVSEDATALTRRMSKNESGRLPLHHAVIMNRPDMVRLLLELGADPDAPDDDGMKPIAYAANPHVSEETIGMLGGAPTIDAGALAFHAKRRDATAVQRLLDHGADPNALWNHWGANLTALHLAAMNGDETIARMLLAAGADTTIRDTMHDGDAAGWAEHHGHTALAALIRGSSRDT